MNEQNLVKTLSVVFVFIVAVSSMGILVADHFLNIASDPRLVSLVTSILGFALSQTGFSQGAMQTVSAVKQAGINAVNISNAGIPVAEAIPSVVSPLEVGPSDAPESV